jgi:glycine/D-amino acid oxidase-like deaminating enzyme
VKEYPYWLDTVADSEPPRSLGGPERTALQTSLPACADVVVVGAGYTGLSAARHLASVGASVVVVERERAGFGASSRNAGQVLTGLKLEASVLVATYGETRARAWFEVGGAAIALLETVLAEEAIACEYERCGHLQAACKPSHFDAFLDEQALLARVFNHRVEIVPRADQRSEVGTDAYYGVMIDEASRSINPAQYVNGLAAAARRRGVCIVPGTAVTAIDRTPDRKRVVTSRGTIEARDVLVATNGYTGAATPALRRRFVPIGSYIIVTDPLPPQQAAAILPRGRMALDSMNLQHYFRLTPDRRLLFGGRAEFSTPDPASTRRAAFLLRAAMVKLFPDLAGTAIGYAWGGNVAFTRDQLPHAGLLEGVYYSGGYCGQGVAMATWLGEQIARRIVGEVLDNPFFDDRFPAIPLYRGTPWFLPMLDRYYKVKDWLQ